MNWGSTLVRLMSLTMVIVWATCVLAQRPRFPNDPGFPNYSTGPVPPGMVPLQQPPAVLGPPTNFPPTNYPPANFPTTNFPAATSLDPYSIPLGSQLPNPVLSAPSLGSNSTTMPPTQSIFGSGSPYRNSLFGGSTSSWNAPSQIGTPYTNAIPGGMPLTPYPAGSILPETTYPSTIYPNSLPPALFPNGFLGGSNVARGNFGGFADALRLPESFRFIQGPRLRHTYLSGGDGPQELGINDTDVSVALTFPNFFGSTQPLYILPSFGLHLWDGPAAPPADLPGAVYDAFLAAGWQSDPNQILGLELGLATGVFSDFDAVTSDSFRIMGSALGKLRITPTATLKLGAMYVDRIHTKLIPAGGILWQPTPYSRFDIYFPFPKASIYMTTLGTYDVWAYIAGEWGGGNWSIHRANGAKDSVDMYDLRLIGGFEWGVSDALRAGRRIGFTEFGWVFNREIQYKNFPSHDLELDDAFMVRVGIGY